MIALQRFKENDLEEAKYIACAMPTLEALNSDRDDFWDDATECYLFGDVLYDLKRDPLSGVIPRDVYRQSFPALHQLFLRPGTFEFYLTVFRSIWGPSVSVTFVIPSPGVLNITIASLGIGSFDFAAREIVANLYQYNPLTDHSGNVLQFHDTIGLKTEADIDALISELSPQGIIVDTTLTL